MTPAAESRLELRYAPPLPLMLSPGELQEAWHTAYTSAMSCQGSVTRVYEESLSSMIGRSAHNGDLWS